MNEPPSTEFWTLPKDTVETEGLDLIYAEVVSRMQKELAQIDGSIADYMLAERAAFIYVKTRDGEAKDLKKEFDHYRNWKETQALIQSLLAQLSRTLRDSIDLSSIRESIAVTVVAAIKESLKGVDPEVANPLLSKLADALEASGL